MRCSSRRSARDRLSQAARVEPALFWLALGAGVLIKGPVILMVSGLTAAGLALAERRARWLLALRPWPYALLALLVVLPWGVAIMLETEGAFLAEAVGHDLIGKVAGAQESHGAPPGFFLVTFWATFWPASLLAALALPWVWRHRREDAVRFCLAWAIPSWLIFELVPTKLPHYTLPLFPAIAVLAARAALEPRVHPPGRGRRVFEGVMSALWLLTTLVLAAALPLIPAAVEHRMDFAALTLGVAALLLFLAAFHCRRTGRHNGAIASLLAACLVFYATAYARVIPELDSLRVSGRVADAVEQARRCAHAVVTSAGYSEPSLVFAVGPATRFGDGTAAAQALLDDRCALALVDRPYLEAFDERLQRAGRAAVPLASIDGFNMARGKRVMLTLFAPPQADGG